jgi:hypothetical protein
MHARYSPVGLPIHQRRFNQGLSWFFQKLTHSLRRNVLHNADLDGFVGQQANRPAHMTGGWRTTGQGGQFRLLSQVQPRRLAAARFLVQRPLYTFGPITGVQVVDGALAHTCQFAGLLRTFACVQVEQNVRSFDGACAALAGVDKGVEIAYFIRLQLDRVQGLPPVPIMDQTTCGRKLV